MIGAPDTSRLARLERLRDRLVDDEPLRILVGHRLHNAAEIVPAPVFAGRLRGLVLKDILTQIEALTAPVSTEGQG